MFQRATSTPSQFPILPARVQAGAVSKVRTDHSSSVSTISSLAADFLLSCVSFSSSSSVFIFCSVDKRYVGLFSFSSRRKAQKQGLFFVQSLQLTFCRSYYHTSDFSIKRENSVIWGSLDIIVKVDWGVITNSFFFPVICGATGVAVILEEREMYKIVFKYFFGHFGRDGGGGGGRGEIITDLGIFIKSYLGI